MYLLHKTIYTLHGRKHGVGMKVAIYLYDYGCIFTGRKHVQILHVVKEHFWVHVLGNHKQQSLCSKRPLSISTVMENARVALQITNRKRRTLKPIIQTPGDSSNARWYWKIYTEEGFMCEWRRIILWAIFSNSIFLHVSVH